MTQMMVSPRVVADRLGKSVKWLREARRGGYGPPGWVQIGPRTTIYDLVAVDRWLATELQVNSAGLAPIGIPAPKLSELMAGPTLHTTGGL